MQIQNPWGALAFLPLAPLLLLYLLRQRHREIIVPSTMLWNQVLAQWKAAHPWQKWRRNLLFFLQAFVICLLALALMRPVWRVSGIGQNHIVILDLSMSMQAEENGRTRLDRAKEGIRQLIGQMQRQEEISLILSGLQNELPLSKTQDKQAALQLLDELEAQNGGSKLEDALQMAASMLDPEGAESIHLFTDRDMAVHDGRIVVHNVAQGAENVAVTSASYSRDSTEGSLSVLGLLYNFGRAKTVQVELWGDGVLLDVRACALEDDSPANVLFTGLDASLQYITLALSEEDSLAADDRAYLVVQDRETYRVLLQTERNVFLEKAVLLRDDIELYKTTPSQELPEERYALIIGDGWMGQALPEQQNLWIIAPRGESDWYALREEAPAQGEIRVAGTGVGDALLRYVDLSELRVAAAVSFAVQDGGATALAYLDDEPLIILREEEGKQLAFGFDFHDSNLPLQKDFPILVQNILEWFLPVRRGQASQAAVGAPVLISLHSDAASYQVRLPDGSLLTGRTGLQFDDTRQPGFYTVTQYGEAGNEVGATAFAVNASSLEESELRTAPDNVEGVQTPRGLELWRNQSLWPWLIICALVLLALEWWVYHRGA